MTAPTVKSVGIDALLYMPGRIVPAVVQLLTVPVLTFYFTVDEIGRYDLAFRFILFLSTFSFLWLNMGILRFYAAFAEKETEPVFHGVLGTLKYASVLGGAGLGLACYWAGPDLLFGGYRAFLPAAIAAFAAYSFYETGLAMLRAKRQPLVYSLATTLNAGLRLPLAIAFFALLGTSIVGMIWATAIMYVLSYWLVVHRHVGPPRWTGSRDETQFLNTVLRYGLPIWITQTLNFLALNLDRYMLLNLAGHDDVGYYAVATNLVEQPMSLVFQTLTLAVFPSVAAAWETQGKQAAEELVGGVTRIFFLICTPLLVLLAVLAEPLFRVLARSGAFEAYTAAPWIAAGAFFYGLTYFANFGLHLSKRTHVLMAMTLIALGANAFFNWILIPKYGFTGSGMARVLSNGLLVLLVAAAGSYHLRWKLPYRSLLRIGVAAALSGVSLYFIQGYLPTNVFALSLLFAAGGLEYLTLLLLLREFSVEDLRSGWHALKERLPGSQ